MLQKSWKIDVNAKSNIINSNGNRENDGNKCNIDNCKVANSGITVIDNCKVANSGETVIDNLTVPKNEFFCWQRFKRV